MRGGLEREALVVRVFLKRLRVEGRGEVVKSACWEGEMCWMRGVFLMFFDLSDVMLSGVLSACCTMLILRVKAQQLQCLLTFPTVPTLSSFLKEEFVLGHRYTGCWMRLTLFHQSFLHMKVINTEVPFSSWW